MNYARFPSEVAIYLNQHYHIARPIWTSSTADKSNPTDTLGPETELLAPVCAGTPGPEPDEPVPVEADDPPVVGGMDMPSEWECDMEGRCDSDSAPVSVSMGSGTDSDSEGSESGSEEVRIAGTDNTEVLEFTVISIVEGRGAPLFVEVKSTSSQLFLFITIPH